MCRQGNLLILFLRIIINHCLPHYKYRTKPLFSCTLMLDDLFILSISLYCSPCIVVNVEKNVMIALIDVALYREIARRRWELLIVNILFTRAYKLWVGMDPLEERSSCSPFSLKKKKRKGITVIFLLGVFCPHAYYFLLLISSCSLSV